MSRTYPHCDPAVIHSPGTCDVCDEYASDLQEIRKVWHIAFTGEEPKEIEFYGRKARQMPCPSSIFRSAEVAHIWYGNRPSVSTAAEVLADLPAPDGTSQP
jgi:hypothetical protein